MSDAPTATGLHAQQTFAPGTVLAGRYRIEAMLGIGGMGVVYRATDLALEVPVALKLLRPELATRTDAFERFRQELLMARQVSSARVVRIHDLAQHDGQWLISMDYVDGESLDHRLDRDGPLPPDDVVRIARQLAEGLAAAHAREVIHRDLKPANVLIDRDGNAYVSDFGVARSLASTGMTQSGAVIGTPDYLSPEQARGERIDARSDLYALGLIMYEMLTGTLPFQGGTISEILAQRMLRSPPPVTALKPQTPAWLARLVDRLLRVQPAHRLADADAVIRAIDTREVPRDLMPGRTGLAWLAVLALVLVGGGFALWRWQHPPAQGPAVAAVAPMHRLLVLPVAAPADALDAASAAAIGAQLRDAIAALPGTAVVDEERTEQALRQLDPTGTGPLDPAALQRIVGADRVLRLQLQPVAGGWRAAAELLPGKGASRRIQRSAGTPRNALAALVADPALSRALGVEAAPPTLALPADKVLRDYGSGLLAMHAGTPAEALQPLRAATTAAPDFAPAWLALATVSQAVGESDAAYAALERGQGAAANAPPAVQRRFSAERALLDGDAPTAVAAWRTQLAATPDDTYAELRLAQALGSGGDFPAAIERLQALAARDPNDPRAWFELGKFSILQGQAQRAVDDHLVRAMVLYKRSGNRYGEAETANALGIGYARLGQRDDAEEQYRKAVQLRRALGNRRGLATSLRNLGNVLSLRGEFTEAAAALKQAGELHAALGDRGGLAAVDNELGLLAEQRGDYPGALAAFRRALQGWQQLGEKPGAAQALNYIGFAHYQLGAYDDAQAYLVQSANAYAELGDQTGQIRARQNLGLLSIARGQWREARTQLEQSLAGAEQQQMLEESAVSLRNLAELDYRQGHLAEAIEHAGKAETLFREQENVQGLADAGLVRVQALLAANADAEARKALAGLAAAIAQAPAEQRGMAALCEAELAGRVGNRAGSDAAMAQARIFARASGVRQLQLQVALLAAPRSATADRDTATLGNVPLRLLWLSLAMEQALAHDAAADAVSRYAEARPLLRRGDALDAYRLHTLGSRALARAGQADAAAAAARDADSALRVLRAHVPASLRAGFDAAVQRTATLQR